MSRRHRVALVVTLCLVVAELTFLTWSVRFILHPVMEREEIGAVVALMAPNEISTSPVVHEFESEFVRYHDVDYALAQCNGTSTLHAASFAVGIGPGDKVITPAYTWHLAVGPTLASHGVPVFADVDRHSLCLIPEDVERKITERTKAISVLHAYRHPAPMDEIMDIARRHRLPVIEDCSHAHGATYKDRHIGTIGDVGCFSLQGSKIIVAGEGGMLVTNNRQHYAHAIALGHCERIPEVGDSEFAKYAYKTTRSRQPASSTSIASIRWRRPSLWSSSASSIALWPLSGRTCVTGPSGYKTCTRPFYPPTRRRKWNASGSTTFAASTRRQRASRATVLSKL